MDGRNTNFCCKLFCKLLLHENQTVLCCVIWIHPPPHPDMDTLLGPNAALQHLTQGHNNLLQMAHRLVLPRVRLHQQSIKNIPECTQM